MKTENNQGFTLLELMIVVGILGVIAAIAIPAYKGYIRTSHTAQCQNEVASIKLAQSEYFLEKNHYFSGTGVSNLYKASNYIYTPSATASGNGSQKKQCDYAVTLSNNNQNYTITATGHSGGNLIANKKYVIVNGP